MSERLPKAGLDARAVDGEMARAAEAMRTCEFFEDGAQQLAAGLYQAFPGTIALARAYVTVPMRGLPERNASWVRDLAEAKGIAAELEGETPIISLVGTAGHLSEWNDRHASKGHVGIPMASASFIDAIPMMSRLMASLGGDLAWIDRRDAAHMVSRLGTVAGMFYVADAATETDARGRKVIPAEAFVEAHGIKTVFGLGGAFASGQLLVLLVFCTERIDIAVVEAMRRSFLEIKSAAAPLLHRVFRDGTRMVEPTVRVAHRVSEPRDVPEAAEQLRTELQNKQRELDELNRLYLDLESQLETRTRSLRVTLDSTGDGMMVVDFDGTLYGETSATTTRWFGPVGTDERAWDYVFGANTKAAEMLRLGLEEIGRDFLPFEVLANDMPARCERNGAIFDVAYRPVYERGRLARVLLVVRDVTAAIAAEQAESKAREIQAIVKMLLRNRVDFGRFMEEAAALVDAIATATDVEALRRDLHTLKGNVAIFGFRTFAERIHRIEDELAACGRGLSPAHVDAVTTGWREALALVGDFLDDGDGRNIEVHRAEYDEVLQALAGGAPRAEIEAKVRSWQGERSGNVLQRLAAQAERLAEQLDKKVDVLIDDGALRLSPELARMAASSLVHVVRNALDHGIESSDERRLAGKPPTAHIALRALELADAAAIEVSDDGRGIDWDAIGSRARAAGLLVRTPEDHLEALFREGISSKSDVSDISGRGYGMSAVRAACRAVGAEIEVESAAGIGTTIRLRLPRQQGSVAA
jgi:two-component sensor histidine kinase/HPt (histidine-containing phosphotransfer) domain-containing protein